MSTITATTDTERVIADMLTENTGRHFLDSGSAYGRHWERNQGKGLEHFRNQPDAWFDSFGTLHLSVFHFLTARLEYDDEVQQQWENWLENTHDVNRYSVWDMQAFAEDIGGTGLYGDGAPLVVNTYNGEDALEQTIQYVAWHDPEWNVDRVLLQIHGGCDVRGGYTAPRAFEVMGYDGMVTMMDNARADITCADGHSYMTDNAGYNWEGWNREPELPGGTYGSLKIGPTSDWETDDGRAYEGKGDSARSVNLARIITIETLYERGEDPDEFYDEDDRFVPVLVDRDTDHAVYHCPHDGTEFTVNAPYA